MSCSLWEHQLDAFVDGELEAEQCLELRSHLDECARCRSAVGSLRNLRAALVRNWRPESAPRGLEDRVRQRLASQPVLDPGAFELIASYDASPGVPDSPTEWDLSRFESNGGSPAGFRQRPARSRRRFLPVAGVVVMLLLVLGLYRTVLPPGSQPRAVTVVSHDKFATIRELHTNAVAARGANLTDSFRQPNGFSEITERLSAMVELKVIAPDLSSEGYEILGGGTVLVGSLPGAQVLYRSAARGLLSVFTVPRMEGLGLSGGRPGTRTYFASTLNKLTVVAWHNGPQTHGICSEAGQDELLRLIDDIPTAAKGFLDSMRSVLALAVP